MTLLIPQTRLVEGKLFESLESRGIEKALRQCIDAEHAPLYVPNIVEARILGAQQNDRTLWDVWVDTPSIRATGRTKKGNAVVVYGHVPHYYSNPDNITNAFAEGKVIHGACILPQADWYALLDKEDGKNVRVVDHNKLRAAPSGILSFTEAQAHPQTVCFLGDRVESYFAAHQKMYDTERIGVRHCDDLRDEPVVRFLCFGDDYYNGFYGGNRVDNNGRFVGVPSLAAEPLGAIGARSAQRENLDAILSEIDALKAKVVQFRQ